MDQFTLNKIKAFIRTVLNEMGVTVDNVALFGSHLDGLADASSDIG